MLNIPFVYGTLFCYIGTKFLAFRLGPFGKSRIHTSVAIEIYQEKTPPELLMHKVTLLDNAVFVSDETYNEEELQSYDLGHNRLQSLKGWKWILENWSESISSIGISDGKPFGCIVALTRDFLSELHERDTQPTTMLPREYFKVRVRECSSMIETDVDLLMMDNQGYPSSKIANEPAWRRREVNYSKCSCYVNNFRLNRARNVPVGLPPRYTYFHGGATKLQNWKAKHKAYITLYQQGKSWPSATVIHAPLVSIWKGETKYVWIDPVRMGSEQESVFPQKFTQYHLQSLQAFVDANPL